MYSYLRPGSATDPIVNRLCPLCPFLIARISPPGTCALLSSQMYPVKWAIGHRERLPERQMAEHGEHGGAGSGKGGH